MAVDNRNKVGARNLCKCCDDPLPLPHRAGMKYCSNACRQAMYRFARDRATLLAELGVDNRNKNRLLDLEIW